MKHSRLVFRSLIYYWRTHVPVILGVAIAVAVLSGALLVGQSVRGSLQNLLFERIGTVEYSVTSESFFSESLAGSFSSAFKSSPIIFLRGVVRNERSRVSSRNVNIYGVDERFWKLQGVSVRDFSDDRAARVGAALSRQLGIQVGDGVLVRVETQQAIPKEWLYGRRDDVGKTLRANCREILPADKMGEFALRPGQRDTYSIFLPLKRLQKELAQQGSVNGILLAQPHPGHGIESVREILKRSCKPEDLGIRISRLASGNGYTLESDRIILDDATAQASIQTGREMGLRVSPLYTYLANAIRVGDRAIPYSVITAADLNKGALLDIKILKPSSIASVSSDAHDSIWLTDWAFKDLGVSIGETVEVDYYLWQQAGKLETRTTRFHLAGVLSTEGDINAALAPSIPGVTNARSINAWDPPFPLDLNRIRPKDEDYWKQHRATPKAFIALARGQELWQSRFGKLTALRFAPSDASDAEMDLTRFSSALLAHLDPTSSGFAITPVKQQGLMASRGSTDFGEYFSYFSSFLIAAAIFLAILFFRLTIEQRAREIGILGACGFSPGLLRRGILLEGLFLSAAGSILGLLGSIGYGWLMVFGLRTWWVGAVGTPRLSFHISWMEIAIGALGGIVVSLASLAWTLRTLHHNSPRMLLSGALESIAVQKRRARVLAYVAAGALFIAILLLISSSMGKAPPLEAFFGAGAFLLISILCVTAQYLRRTRPAPINGHGWPGLLRLGLRNAMHRPGRSLLCACLIASATFIVVSMEAFRQDPRSISLEPQSGTGGFSLLAESVLPVLHDINSDTGREESGILPRDLPSFQQATFIPFRQRPGDDVSCLNLYAPQNPEILGASSYFQRQERFSFRASLATTLEQRHNPWLLLDSFPHEPFIPAIADSDTLQYILHLSLGDELVVGSDRGNPIRLRFVAALRDSVFQGKLIISESNFLKSFPEHEGYRFFLIDAPATAAASLAPRIQEGLAEFGFSVEDTRKRLADYHRVENTYLSTFQSLGTLGLILGTVGLATVLLRNVLERRKELALLRAVGYRRSILSIIIVAENAFLLFWGLASGALCAFVAIMPALHNRGAAFPIAMTLLIMASVTVAGLGSSALALIAAFRAPLLMALRSE